MSLTVLAVAVLVWAYLALGCMVDAWLISCEDGPVWVSAQRWGSKHGIWLTRSRIYSKRGRWTPFVTLSWRYPNRKLTGYWRRA